MHKIEDTDIELGCVERHEDEGISWHGLETVRDGLATDNCGLRERKVESGSVRLSTNKGEFGSNLEIPYIMNPKTELPVYVGAPFDKGTYFLLTNDMFLDFAERCFAAAGLDKKLAFTTTLMEGRKVTIAKRIHEADFKDGSGFEVKSYINMLNSFDGSWKLFANVSETRTVCFNTATANIHEGGAECKHTPDAMEKFIKRFPKIFSEALKTHKGSANDYLKMSSIELSREQAKGFFASLFMKEKKDEAGRVVYELSKRAANTISEDLLRLFSKGRGCFGKSAADAYNAVTEHYTHNGTAEANAPGGTSDTYKRAAKEALLSDKLGETIYKGQKAFAESL